MRVYTTPQTAVANLPYAAMIGLGAWLIARAFDFSTAALAGAIGYALYGGVGALWIMVFVCPSCAYHGTRGCPCGYGVIAARLVPKGARECFAEKFKRHIPVIVPLWLIPALCGLWAWRRGSTAGLVALLIAFVLNSYVLLPLVSRKHGCSECPQRDGCPWMGTRGQI